MIKEKLLCIAIVAFATVNGALLGAEKCTWGPSYWCSHISHAKECGAFQHCQDSVWTKQIIQKDKQTPECTLCQILIDETRQMIKNNVTRETILDFFKSGCNFLPDDTLKQQCALIVKNYIPEFFNLLNSNMTSEQMCAVIQVCSGFENNVQEVPKQPQTPKKPSSLDTKICTDCKNFVTDLQNMVMDNDTIMQMENLIKQTLCSQLGELESECDSVVDQYVPVLLQSLAQQVDPVTTCRILGFCTNGDLRKALQIRLKLKHIVKQISKKSIGKSEQCDLCELAMKEAQDYVRNKQNQDQIKSFIETTLCPELGAFAQECKNMTEQYATLIFDLLVNEFDPDAVCAMIGFCRNSSLAIRPKVMAAKVGITMGKVKSSLSCEACKLAVTQIDALLKKNKTQEEIKDLLDEFCNILPDTYKGTCISVADLYLPSILELLEQELDPQTICTRIGLCNALKKVSVQKVLPSTSAVSCETCKMVAGYVENALKDKKTEEEMETFMDKLCDLLPASVKDECTEIVNTYLPTIILLLTEELSPADICNSLGLCTATVHKDIPKVLGTPDCDMCVELTTFAKDVFKKYSKDDMKAALDKLCGLVQSYQQQCTNYVDLYLPLVMDYLATANPTQLCKGGGFCSARKTPSLPVIKIKNPAECEVCKLVSQELDTLINDKSVQQEVEAALDQVCSRLPDMYQQQCNSLVKQYYPYIVQIIVSELSSGSLCTSLGFCTSSASSFVRRMAVKAPSKTCPICMDFVTEIKKIVGKYSVAQIKEFLGHFCNFQPSYSAQCKDYINTYLSVVLEELKDVSAQDLCKASTLCTTTGIVKSTDEKCLFCETVINYISEALMENSTEQDILKMLKQLCKDLPGEVGTECTALANEYGIQIIQMIQQRIDPKQICQAIKLCTGMGVQKVKAMKPLKDTILRFRSRQSQLNKAVHMEMRPKSVQRKRTTVLDVVNALKDKIPDIRRKVESMEKRKNRRFLGKKFLRKAAEKIVLDTRI